MSKLRSCYLAASLSVVAFAFSPTASAGIDACGDIDLEANAECELKVGGGCKAECTPVNFTATCYVDCKGGCDVDIDVDCTASCEASCSGQCEVDPGSFDCQGSCEVDCGANCSAHCAASNDQASCQASCEANCSGECSASCEATPPSASCEAKCSASCNGHCSAEANVDCQLSCQGECTASLQGGCEVECEKPEGALFCDGQFIDHGGNLDNCLNALRSLLDIEVEGYAYAGCEDGTCSAEAGFSCATVTVPSDAELLPWLMLLSAMVGIGAARRRS